MDEQKAKKIADTIIGQIFGLENPYTLEQFKSKFAFDIRTTSEVTDSITGNQVWVQNPSGNKFLQFQGMIDRGINVKWNTPNGIHVVTLDEKLLTLGAKVERVRV